MLLASFLALALAAADPAPDATAEPEAPTAKSAPVAPTPEAPFPVGAPHDDYGFVGWCFGALSGHMDLYKVVKPELDKQSTNPKEDAAVDAEQMKAGLEYLALYKQAMEAAEKASTQPINIRGGQAVRVGQSIWGPALQADAKTQMWSYLSWDLPGRCEVTAERLYEKSLLSAQALGITIEDKDSKPSKAVTTATTKAAVTDDTPSPIGLRGRE